MEPVNDLVIEVSGLRKTYGGMTAVDGVDLSVRRGEVFGLLGPNGAGKTTTVEICEGYRSRSGGDVKVLGEDPEHASADWRCRIGLVLQSTQASVELTVEECITHFGSFYPSPRPTDEVLALVGLEHKRADRAGKLSGGQQRRLDVALGIVGRPELLFLDEPTTGFDPEARHQFWDLIRALRAEGTTMVLTTHYLDEAEALSDRVAVLAGGRIAAVGDPATLGGRSTAAATVTWRGAPAHRAATDPRRRVPRSDRRQVMSTVTVHRPPLGRVMWSRFVVELKAFVRNPQSIGFSLAFPVMMLLLFASIFRGRVEGSGVTVSQLYVAGLIGSSALSTGFVNTAIRVAFDRERGELKRLAGTPLGRSRS
jgi:ABC-2 type transport system ATP-binding protein